MDTSPSTDSIAQTEPKYGCNCFDLMNQALVEHNTKLDWQITIDRRSGEMNTTVMLATSQIQKKRGARPIRVLPTFCPFCGNRYAPEAES